MGRGDQATSTEGDVALAVQDTFVLKFILKPPAKARAAIAAAVSAGAGLALGAVAVAVILNLPAPAPEGEAVRVALPQPAAEPQPVNSGRVVRVALPTQSQVAAHVAQVQTQAQKKARELDCLTEAVYFEARGETRDGQAAVAQVVLNRVKHPAFPKTVCGVVYQGAKGRGCQFSFACDGRAEYASEGAAWRRARQVAARALAGVVVPQVGSATHFHVVTVQPAWGPSLRRVAQVGLHVFYRLGKPGGSAGQPEPQQAMFTRLAAAAGDKGEALSLVDPADALAPAPAADAAAALEAGAVATEAAAH